MTEPLSMAERMFGTAQTAEAAPATAPPSPASRLYAQAPATAPAKGLPGGVQALRDVELGSKLFDAGEAYALAFTDGSLPGVDVVEARNVAADLQATPDDAVAFQTLAREHLASPASDETRSAWRTEAEKLITDERYTAHDLNLARALVARDPRVAAVLDRSGLGNHPAVVKRFVELARSAKLAGRLK